MPVKLSATIVAYNDYEDIKKAITTIEKFTDKRIIKKIYIVDNGTAICVKEDINNFQKFLQKFTDIEYINAEENLGYGKAHNLVIPYLDSEYHTIINPDIVFCEDAFSKILKYMEDNLEVGMCIPNITDESGVRQMVYRKEITVFDMFIRMFSKGLFTKRIKDHTLQYMDYSAPFQVPFGQGSFLVIRTELFKKIDGFDDGFFMYLEDADLCKRINQVSKLMYYPEATVIHKWRKGSHKNAKLFRYHVESMVYYFKKWGYTFF